MAADIVESQQYITKHRPQEALALTLTSRINCMLQEIKAKIGYICSVPAAEK